MGKVAELLPTVVISEKERERKTIFTNCTVFTVDGNVNGFICTDEVAIRGNITGSYLFRLGSPETVDMLLLVICFVGGMALSIVINSINGHNGIGSFICKAGFSTVSKILSVAAIF